MSAVEASPAPDSLALAVAFHQAPGHFPELLRGFAPLPSDMGRLLRAAGGGALGGELPPATPFGQMDFRVAARFFIEQVLLARDADHYRVLGLNADAPVEQIKEHHRLLMRVFHPDRGADASVVAESIAARINLAYDALSRPESRRAYDAKRREAERLRAAHKVAPPPLQRGHDRPARSLPPVVARNLPQLVLAGVAMVATAAVAWVYVSREPSGALGGGAGRRDETPMRLANVMPPPKQSKASEGRLTVVAAPAVPAPKAEEPKASQAPRTNSPLPVAPPAVADAAPIPAVATKRADDEAAIAPRVLATKMATSLSARQQPAEAVTIAAPPVIPVAQSTAKIEPAASSASVAQAITRESTVPTTVAAFASATTPTAPPLVAAVTPERAPRAAITPDGLANLVAQLSAEYERGDLERFLALFDDAARVPEGGKERIRNDYADLFRTTQARQLIIWDMNWKPEGELYRGEGQYRAVVQRQGEETGRAYTGRIRIDAVPGAGGVARVKGFFH